MISRAGQRLIMGGMVVVAVGALGLGALYQDDDKLDGDVVVGAGSSDDDGSSDADAATGTGDDGAAVATGSGGGTTATTGASGIIEGWLPRSGEASACSEAVGVDLAPGYGAELTINGIEVPPEEMNVVLDPDGGISREITASRSLGYYTFEPDDNCPNGTWLRPVDNVLEVCVYRLSDDTRRCVRQVEHVFDAL